jgi:hypothetical protein
MIATQRGTAKDSGGDILTGVDLKALQQDLLDCVKVRGGERRRDVADL